LIILKVESMKTIKRLLALVLGFIGGFIGLVSIKGFPTNPSESLGSYIGRAILTATAVYLVAYGVGFFPRSKKSKHIDSSGF
jgi:hypothetical protein